MATAVVVGHSQEWISKGVSKTTWSGLAINTTGDVGYQQDSANLIGGLTVMVTATGSLTSVGVVAFEQSMDGTTWTVANSVCGTALNVGSATAALTTGKPYHVRPGALYFRPHFTAGASGAGNVANVIFIQRAQE